MHFFYKRKNKKKTYSGWIELANITFRERFRANIAYMKIVFYFQLDLNLIFSLQVWIIVSLII